VLSVRAGLTDLQKQYFGKVKEKLGKVRLCALPGAPRITLLGMSSCSAQCVWSALVQAMSL